MQVAGMQIHLSGNVFHLNITVIVLMQEIDASFNVELALCTSLRSLSSYSRAMHTSG